MKHNQFLTYFNVSDYISTNLYLFNVYVKIVFVKKKQLR